jgi:predicted nucleotidyltransferase
MKQALNKKIIAETLLRHRDVLRKYKVGRLGIFGSYASGHARKSSDIDLMVEFDGVIDLFDFYHLSEEIRRILSHKVDIATQDALNPYIREKVMREVEWVEGL